VKQPLAILAIALGCWLFAGGAYAQPYGGGTYDRCSYGTDGSCTVSGSTGGSSGGGTGGGSGGSGGTSTSGSPKTSTTSDDPSSPVSSDDDSDDFFPTTTGGGGTAAPESSGASRGPLVLGLFTSGFSLLLLGLGLFWRRRRDQEPAVSPLALVYPTTTPAPTPEPAAQPQAGAVNAWHESGKVAPSTVPARPLAAPTSTTAYPPNSVLPPAPAQAQSSTYHQPRPPLGPTTPGQY
jgi:hypothetical protein